MLDYNYTILLQQDMMGFDVICTNLSNKSSVEFCVDEVFKTEGRHRYERNKERQEFKLGDAQGTPRKYPRRLKRLSLGMPRKASPLSSSTTIGMSRLGLYFYLFT